MNDLSIIIVNYNVSQQLKDCISSILSFKSKLKIEIIVLDNSEKDVVSKDLKKIDSEIKYIKTNENLGYGKAINLGVSRSKGEYIFVLNPDTKIILGRLDDLLDFYKKQKNPGVVAPLLLDESGKPFDLQGTKELNPKRAIFSLSFLSKIFPKNRIYKDYYLLNWNKEKIKEVDVVPGTAFIIKKTLFEKIGGFDERFFLYFEEFDLCKRLRDKGYKNFINPSVKIFHIWGASTSKNKLSKKYFLKSRFYYFRKNFGFIKAMLVETFLRINKYSIILFLIIALAFLLRVYRLPEVMSFIGDTAWFFVSAKNLITQGEIPLVGITSSHTWLHQGPFWTYILTVILPIVKFNPVGVAYFTVVFDLITLVTVYLFTKKYFGEKAALFGSLFYATSPILIFNSQIPYHVNPIPFFTILLIFSVLKWLEGNLKYFPLAIFFIAVLYNFQISILPLAISVLLILSYGILKKSKWVRGLSSLGIIFFSIIAFIIPMIPMLIFDLSHGFSQTLKVGVWIVYKVAVFFGYPPVNPEFGGESWSSILSFIFEYLGRFYFLPNTQIALILFILSLLFLVYKIKKSKFKNVELNIVFIFTIIPIVAYIATKTNSAAYLPMIFSQFIILLGLLFSSLSGKKTIVSVVIAGIIVVLNIQAFLSWDRGAHSMQKKIEASKRIILMAEGKPFSLEMGGSGSQFESFKSNYSYLLWMLGNEPKNKKQDLKFYVEEASDRIIIKKIELK